MNIKNICLKYPIFALALMSICACANSDFIGVEYHKRPAKKTKERKLATITFDSKEIAGAEHIEIKKIRKGYAIRKNLDFVPVENMALTIQKNKKYRWFGGVVMSWNVDF